MDILKTLSKDKGARVLVGFADTVCAPGSVYAAYNVIPSPRKRINPVSALSNC